MYPQIFGKYVLERELARGGMARVVLATLRGAGGFEKKLVVKQIRDELAFDAQFVRRFVEEAKTTVALSHPNIVPVYELGIEQGTYFLAMELVEGVSIAELVRNKDDGVRQPLSPEEGAYVGIELCRALDYAHRKMTVVHRDITPRNVMIDEEGQVKLIDFGIAAPALVAGNEILGSPGHMAPEQVDGKALGPPTDIFAVAVLLMEAWTGAAPFRRATPEECAAAVHGTHPKPSDFDPRLLPLDEAISRAMQVDPRERQQEASELGRALRGFLRGLDVGDIARALGDRVRELRMASSELAPASSRDAPRIATANVGGTTTFAAREEALRWSKPPDAADPVVPSTRRIDDQKVDPAMSIPTPLMVDADDLERVHAGIAARRALAQKEGEAASPSAKPRSKIAIVSLASIALLGLASWWRVREVPVVADPHRALDLATATASASASVPPPVVPSGDRPEALPSASAVMTAARPRTSAPLSAASAPAAFKATVTLIGEPGTRVSLDGSPRGACPVRTPLSEGPHDVRFTFDPTGESRGERFSVKAGEEVTVRAEFTRATPTVTVVH
jgi:serine/threonine-protein kinase